MSDEACNYCETYDPATLAPIGPECGAVGVELLHWVDGRVSAACEKHGHESLTEDAREVLVGVTKTRGRAEKGGCRACNDEHGARVDCMRPSGLVAQ